MAASCEPSCRPLRLRPRLCRRCAAQILAGGPRIEHFAGEEHLTAEGTRPSQTSTIPRIAEAESQLGRRESEERGGHNERYEARKRLGVAAEPEFLGPDQAPGAYFLNDARRQIGRVGANELRDAFRDRNRAAPAATSGTPSERVHDGVNDLQGQPTIARGLLELRRGSPDGLVRHRSRALTGIA